MKSKNKTTSDKTIHALNNQLASISLSIELMTRELYGPLTAKQKKALKQILSEIKKMKNLMAV